MNGPPPTPAATWRLASSPIPFVHVCGVNQRPRASARLRDGSRPRHPAGEDHVRLVGRRTRRRRARPSISANVRVISPPAMRDPEPGRAERREPRQVRPSSGSSTHRTSQLGERAAIDGRAASGRSTVAMSPAIRQPWLRSTMIAIVSPTASRVAATAAMPVVEPARVDPDLERPEAFVAEAAAPTRPAPSAGSSNAARGVGREPVRRAAEERRRPGRPRPGRRCPRAPTSSGQYRPAWKSIVSRTRTWRAIASGSWPMNRCSNGLEPVHRVARADPDHALVGLDADDRDRERRARDRVPGGVERRVQRDPEPVEPDAR